jgi:type IX secretion system PorP/SprF family membrane protein
MKRIQNITILVLMITSLQVSAQINPSPSQYFYNRLFQNVAYTGYDEGLRINGAFRNTTPDNFTGSPVNMNFSIQSKLNERSGLGLQFQNDRAGLLNKNRFMGSYAIDLSKGETRVRLGVGLGLMATRIIETGGVALIGDMNDPVVAAFNQQRLKVDGSIGAMVERNGWAVMASMPSLGSLQEFSGYNAIDYVLANTMISKKIKLSQDEVGETSIQPMIGYRMIQGDGDVLDLGAMLNYKNWIKFLGIYHSNRELALGVGIPYKDKLSFDFTYNTGKVYSKNYMNVGGTLEMHVMFRFGK